MGIGGLSVKNTGAIEKLEWFADNWDMMDVSHILLSLLCPDYFFIQFMSRIKPILILPTNNMIYYIMWIELLVMDTKVAYVTANKFIMVMNYVLGIDLMLQM